MISVTELRFCILPALSIFCALTQVHGQTERKPVKRLYVMNANGTGLKQLVGPTAYDTQGTPVWSADGNRIAASLSVACGHFVAAQRAPPRLAKRQPMFQPEFGCARTIVWHGVG